MYRWRHDPVAAAHLAEIDTAQIERAALTRGFRLRFSSLFLHVTDPHLDTALGQHELVTDLDLDVEYGTGNDSTAAGHGKCSVDHIAQISTSLLMARVLLGGKCKSITQCSDAIS